LTHGGTDAHAAFVPLVLDLLRHGEALPAAAGGDAARPLSPRGIATLERLARHLAELHWRPDLAFSSPLERALETTRIILPLDPGIEVRALDELEPDGEPEGVVEALIAAGVSEGHVLLVGHQPLLGDLTGWLSGGPAHPFAPGAWVRLEFHDGLEPGGASIGLRLRPDEIT
jgi:phosphohistidine phosphatase SixA